MPSRHDLPVEGRGVVARANVLLPGAYAWASTVASPAAASGVSWAARTTAVLALAALVAGPLMALDQPKLGRILGIYAFVGLCVLAWLQLGDGIVVDVLEPVRACLGAVGWSLFAFGWGAVRRPGTVPEDDPRAELGEPLEARQTLHASASWIFAIALVGAVVPLFLAWEVTRPRHALLAHGAALAAAMALVTAGSLIAVQRGALRTEWPPGRRVSAAVGSLTALAVLLVSGLVWSLIR